MLYNINYIIEGLIMNKYKHLREKAVELRMKGFTLNEIVEKLSLSKTTIYYWIKHLKIEFHNTKNQSKALKLVQIANSKKFKKLRDEAYEQGLKDFNDLLKINTFRDFIIIYLTEGFRKSKNTAQVTNSNHNIINITKKWFEKFSSKKPFYQLQYYKD